MTDKEYNTIDKDYNLKEDKDNNMIDEDYKTEDKGQALRVRTTALRTSNSNKKDEDYTMDI